MIDTIGHCSFGPSHPDAQIADAEDIVRRSHQMLSSSKSGIFVRIPQDLLDKAFTSAKRQNRSIHDEIVAALRARYEPVAANAA